MGNTNRLVNKQVFSMLLMITTKQTFSMFIVIMYFTIFA